jgi:hypothetical protein
MLTLFSQVGCSGVVQYAEDLTDRRTGRTWFVRTPAAVGGFVGFGVGVPVSVVALPVTYVIYESARRQDAASVDALSTLLWPSFVLWRGGNLLGTPFDAVEWASYRAWRGPVQLTEAEREDVETQVDAQCLPSYPVEPIYPRPRS